jgi:hypothetical protein
VNVPRDEEFEHLTAVVGVSEVIYSRITRGVSRLLHSPRVHLARASIQRENSESNVGKTCKNRKRPTFLLS